MSIPQAMVTTDRSRKIRLIHYVSSLMILGSPNQTKVFHDQT